MNPAPRAAIDIGTNTVRLLVSGEAELARELSITRLGEGVDASRRLAGRAIERTTAAVETFVRKALRLGATSVRIAATSAVRDASNGRDFCAAVSAATGQTVEVLDGVTEGMIAFDGATAWLPEADRGAGLVVCDIGGGSTELVTATDGVSVDVGSVRLRERFVPSDPPDATELEAARSFVRSELELIPERLNLGDPRLVGVAGTVTTVAALVSGRRFDPDVVHGMRLNAAEVPDWADRLGAMTTEEITGLGIVEAGRADVISCGALILREVLAVLETDSLIVSVRDILDGLLAS